MKKFSIINEEFFDDNHIEHDTEAIDIDKTDSDFPFSLIAISNVQKARYQIYSENTDQSEVDVNAFYKEWTYGVKLFVQIASMLNIWEEHTISVNVYDFRDAYPKNYTDYENCQTSSYTVEEFCKKDTIEEVLNRHDMYDIINIGIRMDFIPNMHCTSSAFVRDINKYKTIFLEKGIFSNLAVFLDNGNEEVMSIYYNNGKAALEVDKLYSRLFGTGWHGNKDLESKLKTSYQNCSTFTRFMMYVNRHSAEYSDKYYIEFAGYEENNKIVVIDIEILLDLRPKDNSVWNAADITEFINKEIIPRLEKDHKKKESTIAIYITNAETIDLSGLNKNPFRLNVDSQIYARYYLGFVKDGWLIPCGRTKKYKEIKHYDDMKTRLKSITDHRTTM